MGELGEFAKHDAEFKALDVQILAVSVDPSPEGKLVKKKQSAFRRDAYFPLRSVL